VSEAQLKERRRPHPANAAGIEIKQSTRYFTRGQLPSEIGLNASRPGIVAITLT
jgi:hypothetical protein